MAWGLHSPATSSHAASMNTKAPVLLVLLALLVGTALLVLPREDDPDTGLTGVSTPTDLESESAVAINYPINITAAPGSRALAGQDPPIVILDSEGKRLLSGMIRLEIARSGFPDIVELGLGSDYDPAASSTHLEALIGGGGIALFAYSHGRKLHVTPARIPASAGLPIVLKEAPATSGMLRVIDEVSREDLTAIDLLATTIPIRPDLPDRHDARFGWSAFVTQVDSPVHPNSALPPNTWVFCDGYIPELVPTTTPLEGMTVVELQRSGVLVVDHTELLNEGPQELRVDAPGWQGTAARPLHEDTPTSLNLPPGRFEIGLYAGSRGDAKPIWEGSCTIVAGKTTEIRAGGQAVAPIPATLSGSIRCQGGLGQFQKMPLVSVYDTSGVRRVKVINLVQMDQVGESHSFGPISLSPGTYRVALTGQAFGETLTLLPGQSSSLRWELPGLAKVTFQFIDEQTGEELSPQTISYWQDPTGLPPTEGLNTRMKDIGFPTMRAVELPAGLTWFRYGLSLGRPIQLEPRELLAGEQVVTFLIGKDPAIEVTIEPESGVDPPNVPVPEFLWIRRIDDQTQGPVKSAWLTADASSAGQTADGLILRAELPGMGRWEILVPEQDGFLQPAPATVDTTAEQGRMTFLLRQLAAQPDSAAD